MREIRKQFKFKDNEKITSKVLSAQILKGNVKFHMLMLENKKGTELGSVLSVESQTQGLNS